MFLIFTLGGISIVLALILTPLIRDYIGKFGFLDHPVEGAQLLDGDHQQRLAEALAAAVDDFAHAANRVAAR